MYFCVGLCVAVRVFDFVLVAYVCEKISCFCVVLGVCAFECACVCVYVHSLCVCAFVYCVLCARGWDCEYI